MKAINDIKGIVALLTTIVCVGIWVGTIQADVSSNNRSIVEGKNSDISIESDLEVYKEKHLELHERERNLLFTKLDAMYDLINSTSKDIISLQKDIEYTNKNIKILKSKRHIR